MGIAENLIFWYKRNKRELPWRMTRDPYKIWLSEIILQQTRVEQGLPYYQRFVEKYPNIKHFAKASEQEILKLWQGLGYYSRALNLLKAAHQVHENYNGKFPEKYSELLNLKGVGPYTAAAIASIAFGEAVPVLDGNVYRVISRLFAIREAIDESANRKIFTSILNDLIINQNPADFNQAIMEFGALYCVPRNPNCGNCPLESKCMGKKKNLVSILPYKKGKTKVKTIYHYYLFAEDVNGKTFLQQRDKKGIWKGLYEFPLIETLELMDFNSLLVHPKWRQFVPANKKFHIELTEGIKHNLSHWQILATFVHIKVVQLPKLKKTLNFEMEIGELSKYPVSRLTDKYLKSKGLVN